MSRAAISDETTSDLMYRLGRMIESRPGIIDRIEQGTLDSHARPLEGLTLDCSVRRPLPAPRPLSAALAATVDADWRDTERLMQRARSDFRQHRDKTRYRADCQQIVEREWNEPPVRDDERKM